MCSKTIQISVGVQSILLYMLRVGAQGHATTPFNLLSFFCSCTKMKEASLLRLSKCIIGMKNEQKCMCDLSARL
jgi:hypothetical protein